MNKGVLKHCGDSSFTNAKTYTLSGKYTYHFLCIIWGCKHRCHYRSSQRRNPLTYFSTVWSTETNGKHTHQLKKHTIYHTLCSAAKHA